MPRADGFSRRYRRDSVSNSRWTTSRGVLDTRAQNETIANACRLYPERFPIGLGNVEVRHEQAGVDELDRAMQDDGLVGFMCHPGLSGHSLGGEMYAFLEVVAMHRRIMPTTSGRFHAKYRRLRKTIPVNNVYHRSCFDEQSRTSRCDSPMSDVRKCLV